MAQTQQFLVRTLAGACALAALAACGGGGGSSGVTDSGNGSSQTAGTLGVSLTDAPSCGYDKVYVTVNKVRVHKSASAAETDDGWTDITVDPAKSRIDLLSLTNGILAPLGQTALEAGHYSQVRLVLNGNSGNGLANAVVLTGQTNETPLITPSAVQSGLKLVNEFDIAAGQRAELVLDFDACKSIVARGNGSYALKPVIKVLPALLNGVDGYVGTATPLTDVHVSAQQDGEIVSSTVPDADGHFYLSRLVPGKYDVVITASSRVTTVVGTVPVSSPTATTTISTKAAPITLLAAPEARKISGTVSFSPASSESAYVAARQALPAGPAVTVRFGMTDANGVYTLTDLPTAALQYAPYSAGALTFSAPAGVTPGAGKYAVRASAEGYSAKTVASVDISQGNQANVDFKLVP
jgi:hypothetical protein